MSQNAVTSFSIIPFFNILFDHVEDVADKAEYLKYIQDAATQTRCKLSEYYAKTNLVTMLCTLLDPQRKLVYFKSRKFPKDQIEELKERYIEARYFMMRMIPKQCWNLY